MPAALRSSVTERIAGLGERQTPLAPCRRGRYRGTYVLEPVPRGRYVVERGVGVIDDPFGLGARRGRPRRRRRAARLSRGSSRSTGSSPRAGAHAQDGRRLLLRRPSGFDLHSVRDYEQGESLRKVHWRTTARRGKLMVKELEDAPRDETAVLLDADGERGRRRRQLRRAGARRRLDPARARAHAAGAPCWPSTPRRGRASRVTSLDGDWLARSSCSPPRSRPGRGPSWSSSRATERPGLARARDLVVTANLPRRSRPGSSSARCRTGRQRRLGRRAELRRPPTRIEPELLRLQAAGVAVAVVRRGDDLAAALGAAARCEERACVRTAAVYSFPALLVAVVWLRLEEPRAAGPTAAGSLVLALAAGAGAQLCAPARAQRSPRGAHGPLGRVRHAARPTTKRGFFGPVARAASTDGVLRFYDVTVPFSGLERRMHGVVLLAIFGFCLAARARDRRPTAAPRGRWRSSPARAGRQRCIRRGASSTARLILAAALWVLAGPARDAQPRPGGRRRRGARARADGGIDLGGGREGRLPRVGALGPERLARRPVWVSYVWDANYGGIQFPKKVTTVLRINGPKRGLYWRATTLDLFDRPLGRESAPPRPGSPDGPAQRSAPPAEARTRTTGCAQDVKVKALRDRHLPAPRSRSRSTRRRGGVVTSRGRGRALDGGLRRGSATRSAATRRGRARRARARAPTYPSRSTRSSPHLESPAGRAVRLAPTATSSWRRSSTRALRGALAVRAALERSASSSRAGAKTPYGAVVTIEAWFRSHGGFTYDEQPPSIFGRPAARRLRRADKRGYCQHFAGAMALMLRSLGIPARVAVGFTSGKRDGRRWTVTDHDAHAWVEVWFHGYGWLAVRPDARARPALRRLHRLLARVQHRQPPARRPRPRLERGAARASSSSDRLQGIGVPFGRDLRAKRPRTTAGPAGALAAAASSASSRRRDLAAKLIRAAPALSDPRPAPARRRVPRRARRLARRPGDRRAGERHVRRARQLVRSGSTSTPTRSSPRRARRRFGPPRESRAAARNARRELRASALGCAAA